MKISFNKKKKAMVIALAVAIFVGLCGIYPHVAFSLEEGNLCWFFNSYDEGFYAWSAIGEMTWHRGIACLGMRGLNLIFMGDVNMAMIAADFLFPFICALCALFAVRPITRSPLGMVAAGLALLAASELLAFRSSFGPFYQDIYPTVESVLKSAGGWFILGNQTSVYWLFRTPEPQVTWGVAFFVVGCALRIILHRGSGEKKWGVIYWIACVLGSFGYMLTMLPVFGALCLAGVFLWFTDPARARKVFVPALCGIGLTFALSWISAQEGGASSLVFPSREPALMITGILGLLIFLFLAIRYLRGGAISAAMAVAGGFALAPILMTNQQLVTGRMIYLLNFENFAFAQIILVAFLLAIIDLKPVKNLFGRIVVGSGLVAGILGVGYLLVSSQVRGLDSYRPINREQLAYASVIRSAGATPETRVVFTNVYVADTMAIILGWRPNYLISRDMIFDEGIETLQAPGDIPSNREKYEKRLFEYLAFRNASAEEFSEAFDAVIIPEIPNWEDRFLVGGFLYSQRDFWEPLSHGRATRSDWIAAEKNELLRKYREFLELDEWPRETTVMVGEFNEGKLQALKSKRKVEDICEVALSAERSIRAVRVFPPN